MLVAASLMILAGASSAYTGGQTIVTLGFDDGLNQSAAPPILDAHNMKGTFYINSAAIGWSAYFSKNDLLNMQAKGHEIGGHTVDHLNLTGLSNDEMVHQISDDRQVLQSMGFNVTSFSYPYGAYNDTAKAIVQQSGYTSARTVSGLGSYNSTYAEAIKPRDPYATRACESITRTTSLDTIKSYITSAEQNGGGWVQLIFHRVNADTSKDVYTVTPETLNSLLDWLQPRSSQGTIVRTAADVISGSIPTPPVPPAQNLIQNPSLEAAGNSIPTGWQLSGYGTSTYKWVRTNDAHTGSWAEKLTISKLTDGDRKLATSQQNNVSAPVATPGRNYDVSGWYKSNQPVRLVVYYKNSSGAWVWWAQSSLFPASSRWTQAKWTTPAVPSGAVAISAAMSLNVVGTVTMDDFALYLN